MNNLDKKYTDLLQDILENGVSKSDRTGTGTLSVFGRQIRHKMSEGFPLLTTKKMAWKSIVTELLWFLRGDTNIKYLIENGCHIWDGDAFKNFMNKSVGDPDLIWNQEQFINLIKTDDDFAKTWGELGPIYGKQWRSWDKYEEWNTDFIGTYSQTKSIDQIANLISELKTNPDSRRLMVNAWNVGELDQMVLPPCHYGFQVYTRELSLEDRVRYANSLPLRDNLERPVILAGVPEESYQLDNVFKVPKRAISLMWNQRSADYFLGVPFNIASYGLLLTFLGKMTGMIPDQLIGRFGDTHLYSNHREAASKQIPREPFHLPSVFINKDIDYWRQDLDSIVNGLTKDDFHLIGYQSHDRIKAPLSN
jgi:thymidylate synthase